MRRRVDWLNVLMNLDSDYLLAEFQRRFRILRRGKYMSSNRCAYYVLKDYYSTTTIEELCSKLGV